MKSILGVSLMICSQLAFSAVGVTVGATKYDKKDGMPIIQGNDQVSVFVCHTKNIGSKTDGVAAAICSFRKCEAKFGKEKVIKLSSTGKIVAYQNGGKSGDDTKHCLLDGFSTSPGYAIIAVGDKGDNEKMYSKAIGRPNREDAMKYVNSNGFVAKQENIRFDVFDTGDNGTD